MMAGVGGLGANVQRGYRKPLFINVVGEGEPTPFDPFAFVDSGQESPKLGLSPPPELLVSLTGVALDCLPNLMVLACLRIASGRR